MSLPHATLCDETIINDIYNIIQLLTIEALDMM